ncbi:hypothetical protein Anas_04553 [Armadillidium nasatum]|uniref:Uncharacterized protein n=1 Tax=Armadillidium nasatum TaxID=96803 RepID=A0A5N5SWS9_9CRUS|nr:hypothetical protein Anas_04553 [Armadillidium nasatum]
MQLAHGYRCISLNSFCRKINSALLNFFAFSADADFNIVCNIFEKITENFLYTCRRPRNFCLEKAEDMLLKVSIGCRP